MSKVFPWCSFCHKTYTRDPNSPRSRSEVFPFEGGQEPDTSEVWQPFAKTEANYFLLGKIIFLTLNPAFIDKTAPAVQSTVYTDQLGKKGLAFVLKIVGRFIPRSMQKGKMAVKYFGSFSSTNCGLLFSNPQP